MEYWGKEQSKDTSICLNDLGRNYCFLRVLTLNLIYNVIHRFYTDVIYLSTGDKPWIVLY